jgi:hypothetical protein
MTGVEHVPQPDDSELCFAAIMSSVTGRSIEEAQFALVNTGLSAEDGTTAAPMRETELQIINSFVTITPFQTPVEGAETSDGVLDLMDEQFAEGRGVTLLHKKNDDPADERHHWTLFTGYDAAAGDGAPLRIIDPLAGKATYIRRQLVSRMIDRSLNYAGLYGYGVSSENPSKEAARAALNGVVLEPGKLTVVFGNEQPKVFNDTYTTTKQGDIKPHEHGQDAPE